MPTDFIEVVGECPPMAGMKGRKVRAELESGFAQQLQDIARRHGKDNYTLAVHNGTPNGYWPVFCLKLYKNDVENGQCLMTWDVNNGMDLTKHYDLSPYVESIQDILGSIDVELSVSR